MKKYINKLIKENKWGIIIDNARIHYCKKFKEYIKKINHVKIIHNIPYSSESNRNENIFNDIKNKTANNNNIIKNINESINKIKNDTFKKYFNKFYNFY